MTNWIMQCNPERFAIRGVLASKTPITQWSITRHVDDLAAGDRVLLWLSGRAAGGYVLGEVTGAPFVERAGPLWCPDDQGRFMTFARVCLDDFLARPVLRSDLLRDPQFRTARIIRQPMAGNPFLTTDDEWSVIEHRVRASGRR